MPRLEASFETVPDKRPQIPANIYTVRVISIERKKSENPTVLKKDPTATNLIVEHELLDAGDFTGFKLTRYISLKMLTEIKRLAMSCGISKEKIEKEGLDPEVELIQKTCRAEIKPNVYIDKAGVAKENSQIANYLIPGDPQYSV